MSIFKGRKASLNLEFSFSFIGETKAAEPILLYFLVIAGEEDGFMFFSNGVSAK